MTQNGERADSAQNPLSLTDLDTTSDEPRIKDVRIGERLGMAQPLDIRRTIDKNAEELRRYGPIRTAREKVQIGSGAVREVTEYHLNEAQTLLLCMLSRTDRAADVRQEVITVFLAWRRGGVAASLDLPDLPARVARLEQREDRYLAIIDRLSGAAETSSRAGMPRPPRALALAPVDPSRPDGVIFKDEAARAGFRGRAQQIIRNVRREAGDPYGVCRFLDDRTAIVDGARIASMPLYRAYVDWCFGQPGLPPATHTRFGRLVGATGVLKEKRGQIFYLNLSLTGSEGA